ncbi:MAG: pyridine nucleotide-disulfide oxidoreductase, partial [Spirochaetes bacterium]|nr:pyridine nucleotide-disulfide oxidoreductase [Spirochaetota bacterium]
GVQLVDVRQTHIGTDRAVALIADLVNKLNKGGVEIRTNCEAGIIDNSQKTISLSGSGQVIQYKKLIVAPGRAGFNYLKSAMERLDVPYIDNMVDIGIRIEARIENYNIANDYYDPKFLFPNRVRTFCTNSGAAYVIKEKYDTFYSANGHSLSISNPPNGLVNFAMLKTIRLTDPITSGHDFAKILGEAAMAIAGNNLLMQRIGDFRSDKRSDDKTFNLDLYDFQPSLEVTAGDISLAAPAKIMRDIWKALKQLDSIVPGILHPSTIMYYPEIKTYATKPRFIDDHFQVAPDVYMAGDGAGTSRGITAAWASGILAAEGILKS